MSEHDGCAGCRRHERVRRAFDRRVFLRSGGVSLVSWGLAPRFLGQALAATRGSGARRKVLVCIFQRGAVDGLNMVVPYGDRGYASARPHIGVPGPGRGDGRVLDLDGFFGFHPALASLRSWFEGGNLAVVHAVGSPDATRSHFDAQDFMESGTPGQRSTPDGWLNRLLSATGTDESAGSLMRAIATTEALPLSLRGAQPALAVGDLAAFLGQGGASRRSAGAMDPLPARTGAGSGVVAEGFELLYGREGKDLVVDSGSEALDAVAFLRAADPLRQRSRPGVQYPRGELGTQLRQIGQLIRADIGVEIAFADVGGWDTHANQGAAQGQLAFRLREFGDAIAAFANDMEDRLDDIVVLTMSEFGRTVEENGTGGTDHGHANASLILGGGVRGGRVLGDWPGLAPEQRFEGRDLALTTDFRDLFGEVVQAHLQPPEGARIFPGYELDPRRRRGLFRA